MFQTFTVKYTHGIMACWCSTMMVVASTIMLDISMYDISYKCWCSRMMVVASTMMLDIGIS